MGEARARRGGFYFGWCVVAMCVLSKMTSSSMTVNTFSLYLTSWSRDLHIPISNILLSMSVYGVLVSVIAPFTGYLADKYPARLLFAAGQFGLVLIFLGISFATHAWQLMALLAAPLAVCTSITTMVVANAVLSRWFVRRLGLALGLSSLGLGLGAAILPPIVAWLLPVFGWRAIWRGAALVVAVVVLPLILLIVRDRPSARHGFHYLTADGPPVSAEPAADAGEAAMSWRTVLARRNFWLLVAAYLPMAFLNAACMQNIAPIAASRGFSPQTAGALLSGLGFAQLAATLGGGLLTDRLGSRLPLAGLGFACAAGGVLVALGQSAPVLLGGMMLVACGGSFYPVLTAAIAAEFGARRVGRAFGMATFFQPLGVLAPFSVARIQEVSGSYVPGLAGMVLLTVLGAAGCLFVRETPRAAILVAGA